MNISFSKYAGVMANFSLIRKVAINIYKETDSYQLLTWIYIVTKSIKMNKSRAVSEILRVGLVVSKWGLRNIAVRHKEKILKIHDSFVA